MGALIIDEMNSTQSLEQGHAMGVGDTSKEAWAMLVVSPLGRAVDALRMALEESGRVVRRLQHQRPRIVAMPQNNAAVVLKTLSCHLVPTRERPGGRGRAPRRRPVRGRHHADEDDGDGGGQRGRSHHADDDAVDGGERLGPDGRHVAGDGRRHGCHGGDGGRQRRGDTTAAQGGCHE